MGIRDAFGRAFQYSANLNRILPFFILNLIVVVVGFVSIDSLINLIPFFAKGLSPATATALLGIGLVLIVFFAVILLAILFFYGTIIDNASKKRQKPLSDSYDYVKTRYLSMLGATIVAILLTTVNYVIPFVGWIVATVFSWFFVFVLQFAIIKKADAFSSLKQSYQMFMNNKCDVFLFWLILSLVVALLFYASLIPVAIALWLVIMNILSIGTNSLTLIASIKANMIVIFIGAVISAFFLSYISVFKVSATTFFFLSKQKKS
jgi:hypothetical protein